MDRDVHPGAADGIVEDLNHVLKSIHGPAPHVLKRCPTKKRRRGQRNRRQHGVPIATEKKNNELGLKPLLDSLRPSRNSSPAA